MVIAVSRDGTWFRYQDGAVDAWAHISAILCWT